MRGGQYEKVVVEGKWERNAPACTNCSFGKSVNFWTGTLIGAVITSCQSKAYFSSGSFKAELRSLDSAFEEAISDLSGLKISLIL